MNKIFGSLLIAVVSLVLLFSSFSFEGVLAADIQIVFGDEIAAVGADLPTGKASELKTVYFQTSWNNTEMDCPYLPPFEGDPGTWYVWNRIWGSGWGGEIVSTTVGIYPFGALYLTDTLTFPNDAKGFISSAYQLYPKSFQHEIPGVGKVTQTWNQNCFPGPVVQVTLHDYQNVAWNWYLKTLWVEFVARVPMSVSWDRGATWETVPELGVFRAFTSPVGTMLGRSADMEYPCFWLGWDFAKSKVFLPLVLN